nr:Major sperm protein domain containing protein [Haemonchus contortus]
MICLSVYLILQFLTSIYFTVQCGGKKKKVDTPKRSKKKHSTKKVEKKKEQPRPPEPQPSHQKSTDSQQKPDPTAIEEKREGGSRSAVDQKDEIRVEEKKIVKKPKEENVEEKKDKEEQEEKKEDEKKEEKKDEKEGKKDEKKEDEKKGSKEVEKKDEPKKEEGEKEDEKKMSKEGEKKDEEKNEGEKEEEKKGDEKDKEKEKEKEKEEEKQKVEELPLDVTMPSPPKEEPEGGTKKPGGGIKLSSSSLAWEPKASQQVLKVTNETDKKQAMKIKCSNNAMFKVNPVFAMIDVGKTIDLVLSRSDGPVKLEKILVLTTPFEGDNAQKAYANKDKVNPHTITVPLVAKT